MDDNFEVEGKFIRIHQECEGEIEKNLSSRSPFGITRLANRFYNPSLHN